VVFGKEEQKERPICIHRTIPVRKQVCNPRKPVSPPSPSLAGNNPAKKKQWWLPLDTIDRLHLKHLASLCLGSKPKRSSTESQAWFIQRRTGKAGLTYFSVGRLKTLNPWPDIEARRHWYSPSIVRGGRNHEEPRHQFRKQSQSATFD